MELNLQTESNEHQLQLHCAFIPASAKLWSVFSQSAARFCGRSQLAREGIKANASTDFLIRLVEVFLVGVCILLKLIKMTGRGKGGKVKGKSKTRSSRYFRHRCFVFFSVFYCCFSLSELDYNSQWVVSIVCCERAITLNVWEPEHQCT